ncbi:MAG TPA: PQQ-binding-like beta-propeller repeat protein [Nitrososphaera sp.]|nr:PQQ-binding-like beta-propeller repeat protein [Nitrososphaera sp.]
MSSATILLKGFEAYASTVEAWEFKGLGDILAMSPTKDVSGDTFEDLVVATQNSIHLVNGATGKGIWTYTTNGSYAWIAVVSSPSLDVNEDGKPEALVVAADNIVMLLNGASGEQVWNFSGSGSPYRPDDVCYPSARSVHLVPGIDIDKLPDIVVVSGSGDQCPKDDRFAAIALSAKNGKKIWEYVHDEDYHGLKDGSKASSPAATVDINGDGILDIAIVDDHGILYIINGSTGNVIETNELDLSGQIWNLIIVPDVSGDNIDDVMAFEFIDGAGGPDYASVDAINLASAEVLWQVKAGDGLYEGGALYSATWLVSGSATQPAIHVALTQRIEKDLDLLLLDGRTGQEVWRFSLGDDKSRNDLAKYYPVTTVPDLNGNDYDEIAVGSIDSMIHLLDEKDAMTIWSHSVEGGGSLITSIAAKEDQRYILVADKESRVNALGALTRINTDLTIDASAKAITVPHKVIISGSLSPPLPGQVVQLRYTDPTGFVITRPLVIAQDGSYTDMIEPEAIGSWRVSANFAGKGYYTSSQSPTITFTVANVTKNSIYKVEVKSPDDNTSVSYPVVYLIEGGQVNSMSIDRQQKSLNIAVSPSTQGGTLRVELQRSVIEAFASSYKVYLDGKAANFNELEQPDEQTRILSIPFSADAKQIQIIGTYVVPEFSAVAPIVLALAIVITIVAIAIQNRGLISKLK